jgi:hypothetical protein
LGREEGRERKRREVSNGFRRPHRRRPEGAAAKKKPAQIESRDEETDFQEAKIGRFRVKSTRHTNLPLINKRQGASESKIEGRKEREKWEHRGWQCGAAKTKKQRKTVPY